MNGFVNSQGPRPRFIKLTEVVASRLGNVGSCETRGREGTATGREVRADMPGVRRLHESLSMSLSLTVWSPWPPRTKV